MTQLVGTALSPSHVRNTVYPQGVSGIPAPSAPPAQMGAPQVNHPQNWRVPSPQFQLPPSDAKRQWHIKAMVCSAISAFCVLAGTPLLTVMLAASSYAIVPAVVFGIPLIGVVLFGICAGTSIYHGVMACTQRSPSYSNIQPSDMQRPTTVPYPIIHGQIIQQPIVPISQLQRESRDPMPV